MWALKLYQRSLCGRFPLIFFRLFFFRDESHYFVHISWTIIPGKCGHSAYNSVGDRVPFFFVVMLVEIEVTRMGYRVRVVGTKKLILRCETLLFYRLHWHDESLRSKSTFWHVGELQRSPLCKSYKTSHISHTSRLRSFQRKYSTS
jgi:hypothetical protein